MKKLRKALIYAAIAVGGLVVLCLLVNAVLVWISSARLEERLTAIRAAGDPVSLPDLARAPIPADRNAATYLRRAQADVKAVHIELAPVHKRMGGGGKQRTEADQKAIRAALDAYPRLIPLLEQAAACPDYNSDLDYAAAPEAFMAALLQQVQSSRAVINLLAERCRLQIADGQPEAALGSSVAILRLARHLENEPCVISHLVVCACRAIGIDAANRALRSGSVTANARAELDAELAHADSASAFARNLKKERAYGASAYHTTFASPWINRAYFDDDQCYHLDLIAQYIALAPRTYAEARPTYDQLRKESQSWRHRVASALSPALEKAHEADIRTRALVRCLRVLNALQQQAAPTSGTVPKLEDLGLPADTILDPFTGSPLHVRSVAGQWVIYSNGTNLTDDGGQLEKHQDVGLGPVAGAGS